MILARAASIREDSRDLRSHSGRLRDKSRTLRARSSDCRKRLLETVRVIENFATTLPDRRQSAATNAREHRSRLLTVEAELKAAIEECTAALVEVRRELGWRSDDSSSIVH